MLQDHTKEAELTWQQVAAEILGKPYSIISTYLPKDLSTIVLSYDESRGLLSHAETLKNIERLPALTDQKKCAAYLLNEFYGKEMAKRLTTIYASEQKMGAGEIVDPMRLFARIPEIMGTFVKQVISKAESKNVRPKSYDVRLLMYAALAGYALREVDFSYALLMYADFKGADLRDAILIDTNLTGVNLFDANLGGTNLEGANLTGAKLTGASLTEAKLTHANLKGATLTGANLTGAHLFYANLTEATLTRVNFPRASLGYAELAHANFEGADLINACLYIADLTGANLTRARLVRADLRKANLTGADLGHAKLIGADLSNAIFLEANLTGADLSYATFLEANLTGADFSHAQLAGADFTRAQLTDTKFDGTIFESHINFAPFCNGKPSQTFIKLLQNTYILLEPGHDCVPGLEAFLKENSIPPATNVSELIDNLLTAIRDNGGSFKTTGELYEVCLFALRYEGEENPEEILAKMITSATSSVRKTITVLRSALDIFISLGVLPTASATSSSSSNSSSVSSTTLMSSTQAQYNPLSSTSSTSVTTAADVVRCTPTR